MLLACDMPLLETVLLERFVGAKGDTHTHRVPDRRLGCGRPHRQRSALRSHPWYVRRETARDAQLYLPNRPAVFTTCPGAIGTLLTPVSQKTCRPEDDGAKSTRLRSECTVWLGCGVPRKPQNGVYGQEPNCAAHRSCMKRAVGFRRWVVRLRGGEAESASNPVPHQRCFALRTLDQEFQRLLPKCSPVWEPQS